MNGQKYCTNCGAVNLENDAFCTNCGKVFTSPSTSPPPAPPPSTSPGSAGYQSPFAPPPKPPRRLDNRYVLLGIVVVVLLVIVVAAAFSSFSSPKTSTSVNTPSPTVQAATAAPTGQPTTQPTATPTVTRIATPAANAPLSSSDLSTIESSLQGDGYTITQHFARNGTSSDGYPMYDGVMTKNGMTYSVIVVQTDSAAHAQSELGTAVTAVKGQGFSGSYTDATTWSGSMIAQDTGSPIGASVLVSGNNVIVTIGG